MELATAAASLSFLLVLGTRAQSVAGSSDDDDDDDDDDEGSPLNVDQDPDLSDPSSSASAMGTSGPTRTSSSTPSADTDGLSSPDVASSDSPTQDEEVLPPPPPSPADVELDKVQGVKSCQPLRISWHYTVAAEGRRVSLRVHPDSFPSSPTLRRRSSRHFERRSISTHPQGAATVLRRATNETITPPNGVTLSAGSFVWQQVTLPVGSYSVTLDAPAQGDDASLHATSSFRVDPGTSSTCLLGSAGSPPLSGQTGPPGGASHTGGDVASGGSRGVSGRVVAAVVIPLLVLLGMLVLWLQHRRRKRSHQRGLITPSGPERQSGSEGAEKDGKHHGGATTPSSFLESCTTAAGEKACNPGSRRDSVLALETDIADRELSSTIEMLDQTTSDDYNESAITSEGMQLSRSASLASNFSIRRKPVPPLVLQRSATVRSVDRHDPGLAAGLARRLSQAPGVIGVDQSNGDIGPFDDRGAKAVEGASLGRRASDSQRFARKEEGMEEKEDKEDGGLSPATDALQVNCGRDSTHSEQRASAATIQVAWQPGLSTRIGSGEVPSPASAASTTLTFSADRYGAQAWSDTGPSAPPPVISAQLAQRGGQAQELDVGLPTRSDPGRRPLTTETTDSCRTCDLSGDYALMPSEILTATRVVPIGTEPVSLSSLPSLNTSAASRHQAQASADSTRSAPSNGTLDSFVTSED